MAKNMTDFLCEKGSPSPIPASRPASRPAFIPAPTPSPILAPIYHTSTSIPDTNLPIPDTNLQRFLNCGKMYHKKLWGTFCHTINTLIKRRR